MSNRIGRQLKVYTASEEGIRKILSQYDEDVEADVAKTIGSTMGAGAVEKITEAVAASAAHSRLRLSYRIRRSVRRFPRYLNMPHALGPAIYILNLWKKS